jgi:prepilin-type processing-associated H-X9-DG protein
MFDNAMDAAQQFTGVHPIKDVLAPLGDTWIAYSDENLAGNDAEGVVFINKLDDAAAAEKGLGAVWTLATNMLNGPAGAGARGQLSLTQSNVQNIRISTVQTPALAINWAIHDTRLIIGFKSDAIVKAATSPPPANGFDQNPQFAALSKRLSNGNAITSFRYSDLTVTAPIMHEQYQQSWQIARMLAGGQGINLPETILPPIDVLKQHVAPTAQVSWTDLGGMHSQSLAPFPGADLFSNAPNGTSSEVMAVGVGAMGVSILLPSLNRARETANRVKCASNERQIGQAILLYSNDHKGEYPPDLGTLILTQDITLEVFICPSGDTSLPADPKITPEQMVAWVNAHGDYVYAGKGLNNNTTPADRVVVYEKLDDHAGDGINMLYGDGHVEFQLMEDAKKLIEGLKDK